MQETVDFYRAMKIGFVNFTVDAETQRKNQRVAVDLQRCEVAPMPEA